MSEQPRRTALRTPSSTAKLDLLIANQEHTRSSIDRLAESVHQLAMSSVRFEEKSSTQETRITSLEGQVNDMKVTVARLEENRLNQQYWLRKIGGTILVPICVGVLFIGSIIYLRTQ